MKTLDFATEFKAMGDTGTFEGYAAIFGNVDQGGDVIERGAFKEFVKTRDGKVLVLYQHSSRDPIGKADVKQDDKGLYFAGQLELNDGMGRKAHALMKSGLLDGMSIGFDVLPGGQKVLENNVRELTKLKLWEISPVTFGMNELARIEAVKAAAQIATIREFENFLRDEAGFSHAQAKLLAVGGWKALQDARDESGLSADAKQLIETIQNLTRSTT